MDPLPLPLCPTCGHTLRFSHTIFATGVEKWWCDPCDQEVTIPAPDDPATLKVDMSTRTAFMQKLGLPLAKPEGEEQAERWRREMSADLDGADMPPEVEE